MWSRALILLLSASLIFSKEFTPARKNRLIFKSHLYDYVAKRSGPEFKKGRQDDNTLDCVPDSTGSCIGDNYKDFLDSAHKALIFRVNQMDSMDRKIKRMKVFKLRVENKAGKTEFFHNVSEILLEAMGGDLDNPVCGSSGSTSGGRQASGISDLYSRLVDCKTLVSQSCIIDEVTVGYNDTLFDECNETNTGLMGKVEECLNYDLTKNEDAKCLCWENIIFKIDKLKSNTFIPQGNETRNCIQAISYSAPMIKDIQLNCTDTVIECKRSEDEAIGIVNACNKNSGGRMLVSNFRSFMDQEEDYIDEDLELYDDDYLDEEYYY